MSQFIKFCFTSPLLDMFRTLIHPSSGACDFSIVSSHWLCSCFDVRWSFGVAGWGGIRVAGFTTNVVIQQKSRRLLMMDVLMSETCRT